MVKRFGFRRKKQEPPAASAPANLGATPDLGELLDELPGANAAGQNAGLGQSVSNSYLAQAEAEARSTRSSGSSSNASILESPLFKFYLAGGIVVFAIVFLIVSIPGTGIFSCYSKTKFDSMPSGEFIGTGRSGYTVTFHDIEGGDIQVKLATRWAKGGLDRTPSIDSPDFLEVPANVQFVKTHYLVSQGNQGSVKETRTADGRVIVSTNYFVTGGMVRLTVHEADVQCVALVNDRKIPFRVHWKREGGFQEISFDDSRLSNSWLHGW